MPTILTRRLRVFALGFLLVIAATLPKLALAHPMGNFSVNHYSRVEVKPDRVDVIYLLDIAEIPTYQEMRADGIEANPDDPKVKDYGERRAQIFKDGLSLQIDGKAIPLRLLSHSILFPAGAGGLPTMKFGLFLSAKLPPGKPGGAAHLHFEDTNFAGRAGWKEVIAAGKGITFTSSSVPAQDRSAELSNYPTDMLNSPPQVVEATVEFPFAAPETIISKTVPKVATEAGVQAASVPPASAAAVAVASSAQAAASAASTAAAPPAIVLKANQQATPRDAFTQLIQSNNLSWWFLLTAALLAAGLGALHALEPGHGKTIVASYLVGTSGKPRHAVFLGLIVTAAHTAGVYLLGAVTLYASRYIVPEQLYPWLGAISGLTITVLAVTLLLRRWTGESLDHSHVPGEAHSHFSVSSFFKRKQSASDAGVAASGSSCTPSAAQPDARIDAPSPSVSLRQLLILGVTGGMVPCPAALVVLLSAVSLHRTGFGLFLIVSFSLGLAAVLIGIGLMMVSAGKAMARFGPRFSAESPLITRWLPLASAIIMGLIGLGIAGQAIASTPLAADFIAAIRSTSFAVVALLGLFLGMRHSTDPDHVVAVTTIVSKQRRISSAVMVGCLWGIGHTFTIVVVGSAIILFGLVIPPRVGLSMEFSVALMLILLGLLNLTGLMQKITAAFTPGAKSAEAVPEMNAGVQSPATSKSDSLLDRLLGRFGLYQMVRPLLIGTVHGLAGSAAVALLVLSTIKSTTWAVAYLLIFGLGTVFGMMLITLIIALPFVYTEGRFLSLNRHLATASGLVSFAFGLFLVYQIGFSDGLFTAHPTWTPQ